MDYTSFNVYVCEVRDKKDGHRQGPVEVIYSRLEKAKDVAMLWAPEQGIQLHGQMTLMGLDHASLEGSAHPNGTLIEPHLTVEVHKARVGII